MITRGSVPIAEASGFFVSMPQVPQVGDVVSVESPIGAPVASITYDGLPSLDSTVCIGSANFSGQRSGTGSVQGGYFSLQSGSYRGGVFAEPGSFSKAQISTLSGSAFAGSLLTPLTAADTVFASEEQSLALAGGGTLQYFSETERAAAACPPPPPPVAVTSSTPPPLVVPLKGQLLRLRLTSISKLLKSGWILSVSINGPGTVTQDLYLQDGKLPAQASRKKRVKRATLVARGATRATRAGIVKVHVRATPQGRHLLKRAKHVKLVLITTLRNSSGVRINLARRTVTLRR